MGDASLPEDGIRSDIRAMILEAFENDHAATCVTLASGWLVDHPNDLGVIICHAQMLYKMARYDEAIPLLVNACERFPESRWSNYCLLGNLFRYRGDFEQACVYYQRAVDEDPDEASSLIFLGSMQARLGNLRLAESTHRRAIKCSKGCVDEAFHNLGLVLRGQGRMDEARECFDRAIALDADDSDAIEALADVECVIKLKALTKTE